VERVAFAKIQALHCTDDTNGSIGILQQDCALDECHSCPQLHRICYCL